MVDNSGVVGQVTRVYPWLSEVTLVTDKDIAVPIQVVRNGVRAVVFGSGNISELELRYQPVNADIEVGDVLVTSGMDGTYPPALPVAKVTKVDRDPAYPFAHIACVPLAGVDRHRTLLIVSSVPPLPERPVPKAKIKRRNVSRIMLNGVSRESRPRKRSGIYAARQYGFIALSFLAAVTLAWLPWRGWMLGIASRLCGLGITLLVYT